MVQVLNVKKKKSRIPAQLYLTATVISTVNYCYSE